MINRSQLEKWNAGKYNELDKKDLIVIGLYFQNMSEGYESSIDETK